MIRPDIAHVAPDSMRPLVPDVRAGKVRSRMQLKGSPTPRTHATHYVPSGTEPKD